jgi:hypothetical protein
MARLDGKHPVPVRTAFRVVFFSPQGGETTVAPMARRPLVLLAALALLAAVVAVPVLAGNPNAPGQQKQKDKAPEAPITLNGTITSSTDSDGRTSYTLTDGGTTYTLEAGPHWFFGDKYPLEPYVGKSVKVEGEVAEGSTEVDVHSIDGVALREPGKPPWAGGWKVVGKAHPGWSQEKADRFAEKFGDCWPPGHCKDHGNPAKPDKAGDDADEAPEAE